VHRLEVWCAWRRKNYLQNFEYNIGRLLSTYYDNRKSPDYPTFGCLSIRQAFSSVVYITLINVHFTKIYIFKTKNFTCSGTNTLPITLICPHINYLWLSVKCLNCSFSTFLRTHSHGVPLIGFRHLLRIYECRFASVLCREFVIS
jgi:hypothetical protein